MPNWGLTWPSIGICYLLQVPSLGGGTIIRPGVCTAEACWLDDLRRIQADGM